MKRLFPIFLFITALLSPCCAQTVPSEALQQAMQRDETAFLQSMSPTLQHTQALAVRMAIQGDVRALQQIRESRNVAPTLPEGVKAVTLTPTMTLFRSTQLTSKPRPSCSIYMGAVGALVALIVACAFVLP